MSRFLYTSPAYTATSFASTSTQPVRLDFLPVRGPNGHRLIAQTIIIHCDYQLDTNGTADFKDCDVYSLLNKFRVYDGGGNIVDNLSGMDLRLIDIHERGQQASINGTAIAVSQTNSTGTVEFVVHAAPPRALRQADFGWAIDDLKATGGMEITFPSTSSIQWNDGGSGSVTLDSITYRITVVCREESDVQMHSRLVWHKYNSPSGTDLHIPVNGALLRDVIVKKDTGVGTSTTSGHQDASSVGDIDIPTFGMSNVPYDHVLRHYLNTGPFHDETETADPFVSSTALAVWFAPGGGSIARMPRVSSELYVKLNSLSLTNVDVLYSLVTGRSRRTNPNTIALANREGLNQEKVKTAGKSAVSPERWGDLASYMPAKFTK